MVSINGEDGSHNLTMVIIDRNLCVPEFPGAQNPAGNPGKSNKRVTETRVSGI